MLNATTLCNDITFGEGPRWHQGRLWFSDFYDRAVKSVDVAGSLRVEHRFTDQPSGLGWLPDGSLLVVSMGEMQLLRQGKDNSFAIHAELGQLAVHMCNDMVVDSTGRAYVGHFGFDMDAETERRGGKAMMSDHPMASLIRVDPDGSVQLAADDLDFPNGCVVTPDGATLIVAETLAGRLSAFDIAADGSLSNRRVWAPMDGRFPDGICLDEKGQVWVADAGAAECVLVAEGGEVIETVQTSQNCFACALGGDDGRDLFIMTAETSEPQQAATLRGGKVETARVSIAG